MAKQPAPDPHLDLGVVAPNDEGRYQVVHNIVIVPGIEGDATLGSSRNDTRDDIKRAVAVERCYFYRHDLLDLGKTVPEIRRQWNAADGSCR